MQANKEAYADSEFELMKVQARRRIDEMDAIDGFRDRELKTIAFALEAGLKNKDIKCAMDALVMLEDRVGTWTETGEWQSR